MSKFVIEPHFRLQEWVAEEKGYFLLEGLDTNSASLFARPTGPTTRQSANRALSRVSRKAASRT